MDVSYYANQLVPFLKKKSKLSYLGAALALVIAGKVYSFFRVPRSLRHISAVSYLSLAKSFFSNESVADRNRRLILPVANKSNGFYLNKMPVSWVIYITNPLAAKAMLLKTDKFPKSIEVLKAAGPNSPLVRFLGHDNVAFLNGESWKAQRMIMNPAFRRAAPVQTFGNLMLKVFTCIDQEKDVSIIKLMQRMTLDALGISVFGFDFKALEDPESVWVVTYNKVIQGMFDPVNIVLPRLYSLLRWVLPGRRECEKATVKMNELLLGMAQERREALLQRKNEGGNSEIPDSEKDLLTLMLEAEMRGEGTMSNEELRSNLSLFFLAGHETTSNSLTFCLYYLAINKHMQERARKEILDILGDHPSDVFPTTEQCKEMTYLDMVIKENLRKTSPADQLMPRVAVEDTFLDGTFIPKGSRVSVAIQAMHDDPKVWKDPDTFDPERFSEHGEFSSHAGMPWLPFSNGSRQCLGLNFSLAEQRVVMSMILRKYVWELPDDSIHKEKLVFPGPINMGPKTLTLNFTKRY